MKRNIIHPFSPKCDYPETIKKELLEFGRVSEMLMYDCKCGGQHLIYPWSQEGILDIEDNHD